MPNDHGSIEDGETTSEKWDRARSIFLESLYKPDDRLRGCAHNQKCFYELMEIKDQVIEHVRNMKNPNHIQNDYDPYNNIPQRY
tara:strand:+ start:669 stop:920 length:252 start_codon:yes stop_codon:yes gene_type:complete